MLKTMLIDTCINCGKRIVQPPTGRRRLYCSERCRKRAARRRQATAAIRLENREDDEISAALSQFTEDLCEPPLDPDEAVVQTVVQALAVVSALGRCAESARPQFAWRCAKAAEELHATLKRYFVADDEKIASG